MVGGARRAEALNFLLMMALREALRRRSRRLYDAERRVWERAEWVKIREGVVGGREMAVSRREEEVSLRELEVRRREDVVLSREMQVEEQSSDALWGDISSGEGIIMCLQWNVNLMNINFWLVTALDESTRRLTVIFQREWMRMATQGILNVLDIDIIVCMHVMLFTAWCLRL